MALGGFLVEHVSLRAAFATGAAIVAAMALVALTVSPQPAVAPARAGD
jgi:hypothetical protein